MKVKIGRSHLTCWFQATFGEVVADWRACHSLNFTDKSGTREFEGHRRDLGLSSGNRHYCSLLGVEGYLQELFEVRWPTDCQNGATLLSLEKLNDKECLLYCVRGYP